ncbi:MAG: hypothetical protein E7575_00480 [Ruminococcaceae bacterium]|nr:hypothetical protein [Oscillospiraceae bacterium]
MKKCNFCGKELFDEAVMCPDCKRFCNESTPESEPAELTPEADTESASNSSPVDNFFGKKKKTKAPLIIAIAVAAVLAIAAAVVFLIIKPFDKNDGSASAMMSDTIEAFEITKEQEEDINDFFAELDSAWEKQKDSNDITDEGLYEFSNMISEGFDELFNEIPSLNGMPGAESNTQMSAELTEMKSSFIKRSINLHSTLLGYVTQSATGKDCLYEAIYLINSASDLFYATQRISAEETDAFLTVTPEKIAFALSATMEDSGFAGFETSVSSDLVLQGTLPDIGVEVRIETKNSQADGTYVDRIELVYKSRENVSSAKEALLMLAEVATFLPKNTYKTISSGKTVQGWIFSYGTNDQGYFAVTVKRTEYA